MDGLRKPIFEDNAKYEKEKRYNLGYLVGYKAGKCKGFSCGMMQGMFGGILVGGLGVWLVTLLCN